VAINGFQGDTPGREAAKSFLVLFFKKELLLAILTLLIYLIEP